MSQFERNIAEFHSLKPSSYYIVEKLAYYLSPPENGEELNVSIILRHRDPTNASRLNVTFIGASRCTFDQGTWVFGFSWLYIEDVHQKQWEGANYRVVDYDNRLFSLYCRDFVAFVE